MMDDQTPPQPHQRVKDDFSMTDNPEMLKQAPARSSKKTQAKTKPLSASQQLRADGKLKRASMLARWSHKNEGTPETHERIAMVPSRRRQSPIDRMLAAGKVSREEHLASIEIADIVEMIERAVTVRCASLEARVDNQGSARDVLIESIGRIRMEVAYRSWRAVLPKPARLYIDMIVTNQSYVALARLHGVNWRLARKRLMTALRRWPEFREEARLQISREYVTEAYARLGEGVLLPPRPKFIQPEDEEGQQDHG